MQKKNTKSTIVNHQPLQGLSDIDEISYMSKDGCDTYCTWLEHIIIYYIASRKACIRDFESYCYACALKYVYF